jgi:uncharacterized protein YjhX (UPF0386 family)
MYKDLVTQIVKFEDGRLSSQETIELFQTLIDTKTVAHLQGGYQRIAQQLVDEGLCHVSTN